MSNRILVKASAAALTAGAAVCGSMAAHAQGVVNLEVVPSKAMRSLGGYMPVRTTLSKDRPSFVTKIPDGLTNPQYGVILFGPKASQASIAVIIDEPAGHDARVFVDANGNGDLTDDPAVEWIKRPYKGAGGVSLTQYHGAATLPLSFGGKTIPVSIGFYRFDPADSARAVLKDVFLYYRDYAVKGEAKLAGKSYNVMLDDMQATGDFSNPAKLTFCIDVNGNGVFDGKSEMFGGTKPFNIGGTTYELAGFSAGSVSIQKSAQTVAEIAPAPVFKIGQPIVGFETKATDGTLVKFPTSYKGKIVMLDFWATWCGPCKEELPNVTKVYQKYHSQGFEILGISLDQKDAAKKLSDYTSTHDMPWQQVYDGKYWEAEIAVKYDIHSIPAAFLVDGDTGILLAEGDAIRGDDLERAVSLAFAKKKAAAIKAPAGTSTVAVSAPSVK